MKTIRHFSMALLMLATSIAVNAQSVTETFAVSGNCGMCKTRIEKAAKQAGASEASWSAETKMLSVTYSSENTGTAKIQQAIADAGHDNAGFKASMEVYNKLPGCCKYDKSAVADKEDCCKDGKCKNEGKCDKPCCKKEDMKMDCCKDGKCKNEGKCDKPCCKKDDMKMDCCKDGKCKNEGKCDKPCCKKEDMKMDCCKEGSCQKEGHSGKDCCKKS